MAILNTASLSSKVVDEQGNETQVSTSSNTSRIEQLDKDVKAQKSSARNWVVPKDELTITTTITNDSQVNIEDLSVSDTIGTGATFVAGSLKIGEQPYEDYDPTAGFVMPVTLGAGASLEMTYDVKVDEFPTAQTFADSTTLSFEYDSKSFSVASQPLSINILDNEISVLKQADSVAVKSGATITYTITISNTGEVKNTDLVFTDSIPEGTEFVAGSVKVDGAEKVDANPSDGISLGDLDAAAERVVEFKVTVK